MSRTRRPWPRLAKAAEAIELDAKDAQTFGETSPEETAELQRQAAVQMARLHAAGNMGADPRAA